MIGVFLTVGLFFGYGMSWDRRWLLLGPAVWAGGLLLDLLVQPWTRRVWAFEGGLVERSGGRLSPLPWDEVTLCDWHAPDHEEPCPHQWGLRLGREVSPIGITESDAELLLARIPGLLRDTA